MADTNTPVENPSYMDGIRFFFESGDIH